MDLRIRGDDDGKSKCLGLYAGSYGEIRVYLSLGCMACLPVAGFTSGRAGISFAALPGGIYAAAIIRVVAQQALRIIVGRFLQFAFTILFSSAPSLWRPRPR